MTPDDSLYGEPQAFERSVPGDRLIGVCGTGRMKAARWRKKRRDDFPVEDDEEKKWIRQKPLHGVVLSTPA